MIRTIEASNFRMMRANRVSLGRFHVLVGPNASGKTTFLDALQFVSDVVERGVRQAVADRSPNFHDLCFTPERPIGMAVELDVPSGSEGRAVLRHEIEVGIVDDRGLRVLRENLFVRPEADDGGHQRSLFGDYATEQVVKSSTPRRWRKVVGKTPEGRDYFQDEKTSWNNVFRFGDDRSAVGSMPEDPDRFPLALAARRVLREGVRRLALDPRRLAATAPPGGRPVLGLDGSNLPYVVRDLRDRDPRLFQDWVRHVSSAVGGLKDVDVLVRDDDRHLVLRAQFEGSHEQPVPSWLLSDGTLRLMALTVLSYASTAEREEAYLVEEPENGLHPLAIQAAFSAISSPLSGHQWLCATHSPVFLAHVGLDDVLVFRRDRQGYSIVRHGDEVPELAGWTTRRNLSDLLVAGVLS